MKADDLQWEYCPISDHKRHTQYRGFDIHAWVGFICFYPTEGEATVTEIEELRRRIIEAGCREQLLQRDYIPAHGWQNGAGVCALKQRAKGDVNCCLEAPVIEALDTIIDTLLEQSGLGRAPLEASRMGRVR